MSKHTPGPWILFLEAPYPIVQRGRTGGFQVMAPNPSIALADARLIAAAPELLEALQAMLEVHGVNQAYADKHIEIHQSWVDLSDIARAAIAKATGEQQ